MLRRITREVGRFREGGLHDYPVGVWRKIAQDAGLPLEEFSTPVGTSNLAQNPLKGRVRVHKRLGGTQ